MTLWQAMIGGITNIGSIILSLYLWEKWRFHKLMVFANWLVCAFLLLRVCISFWNRFVKLRFYGGEYTALKAKTRQMLSGYLTQSIVSVCCLTVIGTVLELCHFLWNYNWLVPGFFCLLQGHMVWSRLWEPPLALYLGSSQTPQVRLCAEVMNPMWPLRIATLLQVDSSMSAWWIALSNLRSYRSDSAQFIDVVEELMSFVRVIIVDARSECAPLVEEIQLIRRKGLQYKTLFVGDDSLISAQFFRQLSVDPESAAVLSIDAGQLRSFVILNFAVAQLRPSPEKPLVRFHMTPLTELKRWAGRSLEDFELRKVNRPSDF